MKTPYDGRFKNLAEEFPDLLLRLLGILKPGTKYQPVHILRELQLDPVQIDHAYLLGEGVEARIVHFEAIASWRNSRVPILALYRFLLRHIYKLPITSYAVLMAEKYAPKEFPERIVFEDEDGLRIETRYTVIALWKVDPAIAFEPGCEALLPWVPLLKGGAAEFERAAAAVELLADHPEQAPYEVEAMVNNLAVLATLRYDKDVIRHFLERLQEKLMFSTDLFEESWLYKDGVAAGQAKGEAKGRRGALTLFLQKRFPGEAFPELDRIERPETLDAILLTAIDAHSAAEIRAAIEAALPVH